jgi:protein-L-isoaspartate(D-aspartate) O-methyltransferase
MTDFAVLRERMVDNQIRPGAVTDHAIIRAFLEIPRELFTDPAERVFAYADPEVMMSAAAPGRRLMAPVLLARLLQGLQLEPSAKLMVVACGSGYSAAIASRLAATVVGVEEEPALADLARDCLQKLAVANVEIAQAKHTSGYPAGAPYDAVLIDGSVEEVPQALVNQLKPLGRLAAVRREERISRAMIFERAGEGITGWPLLEAWASPLPGFERPREFVF